jgi:hypothetical protein
VPESLRPEHCAWCAGISISAGGTTGADLLIVDEIGYLPCDRQSADLFYNIISRRHGRRSTVVTTSLAFKQWSTMLPEAACVGALVDRSSHQCHPIDIDADSWRNKESQTFHKKLAPQPKDVDKPKKAKP